MKKHLLIAGLLCVATIPPASAVTKCVKLLPSSTCSGGGASYYQTEWKATCGSVGVSGVAVCGLDDGSENDATDSVRLSPTTTDNKYCWCKMVSPAVSRWAFYGAYSSAGDCTTYCADACGRNTLNDAPFRAALFDRLSD